MKKTITAIILTLFCVVSLAATVHADKGNKRKGKYIYRTIYKTCSQTDTAVSPKPSISPDSRTMAQWDRFFKKGDYSDFGCKAQWDDLSDTDRLHILTYMKSGAADSPTPAKCE